MDYIEKKAIVFRIVRSFQDQGKGVVLEKIKNEIDITAPELRKILSELINKAD